MKATAAPFVPATTTTTTTPTPVQQVDDPMRGTEVKTNMAALETSSEFY